MTAMDAKPLPRITAVNRPFFEACNRDELRLQRCLAPDCRCFIYFPRVCCPHCQAGELVWQPVSGRGRIVSFAAVRRPQHHSFFDEAPYYFAALQLDEGPLLYSRLAQKPHLPDEDALIGAPVRAQFVDQGNGQKLPYFSVVD